MCILHAYALATTQNTLMQLHLPRICLVVWFILAPVTMASSRRKTCPHERDTLMPFRKHEEQLVYRLLAPVQDAAIELHGVRHAPHHDTLVLEFPHQLVQVYDDFTDTCMDHEWVHSLLHRLCGVFAVWETQLSQACAGTEPPTCICTGVDRLLESCQHGVMPWGEAHAPSHRKHRLHDDNVSFCATLLSSPCIAKGGTHPLSGLCAHFVENTERSFRHTHARALRRQHNGSHKRHGTLPQFVNWAAHNAAAESRYWGSHARDRLHPGEDRPGGGTRRFDSAAGSSTNNVTDSSIRVSMLIRSGEAFSNLHTRSCIHPISNAPLKTCTLPGHPVLFRLLQQKLPECTISVCTTNTVAALREGSCQLLFVWPTTAERLHRHTEASRLATEGRPSDFSLQNPSHHRIRLYIRNNQTLLDDAVRESKTRVGL